MSETIGNTIVLLGTNAFELYILHRFMGVFFTDRKVEKREEIMAYLLRYVVTSAAMLWAPYPIVNSISSVFTLFFITLCYESAMSKRLVTTIIIYGCFFMSETLVALLMRLTNFEMFMRIQKIDSFAMILIEVIVWGITLLFQRFRNVRKDMPVPGIFTAVVLAVCFTTILLGTAVFGGNHEESMKTLTLLCVLFINVLMIFLYDFLSYLLEENAKVEIVKREKTYYHKQSELLQKNQEDLKKFRHDMKNRLLAIQQMVKKKELKKIESYIMDVTEKIEYSPMYSRTGNIVVDSIINYKLTQAKEMGAQIYANAILPESLNIEEDDLVIILGNLLDNAIEAIEKAKDGAYIRLQMEYEKNCFFLKMINSYDNVIKKENGQIITRKKDTALHGIGLRSVKDTVEKYDGILELKHDEKEFFVSVMLYI